MSPDDVHVRVAVGEVRLEYRGDRAFYERLVEPLVVATYARGESGPVADTSRETGDGQEADGQTRGPDAPAAREPTGPIFTPTSPARFQQFAGQVGENAATVEQRIMAFAFYLWNYEREEAFPLARIESFFRTVQEDPPPDIEGRLVDLAERKRFLEAGREAGDWRLTPKGVNYVKNRLLGAAS